jgi:hypothetical protein
MTIFVKDVMDITIAGAKERIVTRKRIIRERLVSLGDFASFTLKLRLGIGILVSSAFKEKTKGNKQKIASPMSRKNLFSNFPFLSFVPKILLCLIYT